MLYVRVHEVQLLNATIATSALYLPFIVQTSAWLSEDGSPINFTTALSCGVDETQTTLDQNETRPHIVYRSICEKVTAAPAMTIWSVSIVSLLLIGIAVVTLRRRKGGSWVMVKE
jgi:hypothetical protein